MIAEKVLLINTLLSVKILLKCHYKMFSHTQVIKKSWCENSLQYHSMILKIVCRMYNLWAVDMYNLPNLSNSSKWLSCSGGNIFTQKINFSLIIQLVTDMYINYNKHQWRSIDMLCTDKSDYFVCVCVCVCTYLHGAS